MYLPQYEHTRINAVQQKLSQVRHTVGYAADNAQVLIILETELYIEEWQSTQTVYRAASLGCLILTLDKFFFLVWFSF